MISLVIVDSGPLLAATNRADPEHASCLQVLEDPSYRLIIPASCVAEVSYILAQEQGARVEAQFLRGLREMDVRGPATEEWSHIAELVESYRDLPLEGSTLR